MRGDALIGNLRAVLPVFVALSLFVYFSTATYSVMAANVRSWADLGMSWGGSILGFALAGFTIFATLSRPKLFVFMAKCRYTNTHLTVIKSNFFPIINVFVVYLFLIMCCALVKLFGVPGSAVSLILSHLAAGNGLAEIITRVALVALGTVFWFSLYLLKSFIYNVYNIVVTGIAHDINESE